MDLDTFLSNWHSPTDSKDPLLNLNALLSGYKIPDLLSELTLRRSNQYSEFNASPLNLFAQLTNYPSQGKRSVLTIYNEEGPTSYSLDDLIQKANFLADSWSIEGLNSDSFAVVIYPYGIDYLAALLAAIKIGAKFSVIPPESGEVSPARLEEIVDQCAPDYVLTNQEDLNLSSEIKKLCFEVAEKKCASTEVDCHTYEPDSPVFCNPLSLKETSAQTLYVSSLLDGAFTFNMTPTDSWCRLESFSINDEPYCSLLALFHACEIIHINYNSIFDNPDRLKSIRSNIYSICPKVRDLMLANDLTPTPPRLICFSCKNGYSPRWENLIQKKSLKKTLIFQAFLDGHCGGYIMYSSPSKSRAFTPIYPRLDLNWTLNDTPSSEAINMHLGRFNTEDGVEGCIEISRFESGWSLLKSDLPYRLAKQIPILAIEKAAQSLEFVESACVYTSRDHVDSNNSLISLLVFVSPYFDTSIEQNHSGMIRESIADLVGTDFLPDKINFFPICPKLINGVIDRNWCIDQYLSGKLKEKSALPAFKSIYKLRWQLIQEVQECQNS